MVEDAERARRRVARSLGLAASLRGEIADWLKNRRDDQRFAIFDHHFEVLDSVLSRMLDAIASEFAEAGRLPSSGEAYERCRELDRSLVTARRLFEWYAGKYDQRLDDGLGPALRAADEIVRSCWQQPFAVLGRVAPTGPLPYFDVRFDAHATPRVSVPPDLRAPADAPIADLVARLPIPAIGLPVWASAESWWLVLAAHEIGHHVQHDLAPTLENDTRAALTEAVRAAAGDDGAATRWAGWGLEVFADAYSVLMVGGAACWAIDELEHAPDAGLAALPRPGDRYPPPAVRRALLGELARQAGAGDQWPGAKETGNWLGTCRDVPTDVRIVLQRLLAAAPAAAAALLDLDVNGRTLRQLSGTRPEWFGTGGRVDTWARRLTGPDPVLARLDERHAARLVLGAGVTALAHTTPDDRMRLHNNLVELLPVCGPPGRMGAAPPPTEVGRLADDLARRLLPRSGR